MKKTLFAFLLVAAAALAGCVTTSERSVTLSDGSTIEMAHFTQATLAKATTATVAVHCRGEKYVECVPINPSATSGAGLGTAIVQGAAGAVVTAAVGGTSGPGVVVQNLNKNKNGNSNANDNTNDNAVSVGVDVD